MLYQNIAREYRKCDHRVPILRTYLKFFLNNLLHAHNLFHCFSCDAAIKENKSRENSLEKIASVAFETLLI